MNSPQAQRYGPRFPGLLDAILLSHWVSLLYRPLQSVRSKDQVLRPAANQPSPNVSCVSKCEIGLY